MLEIDGDSISPLPRVWGIKIKRERERDGQKGELTMDVESDGIFHDRSGDHGILDTTNQVTGVVF